MSDDERVQPQDTESERVVLGAMLSSPDAVASVLEILKADDFYQPTHSVIFGAIVSQYAARQPSDPVGVTAALLASGDIVRIGGATYLSDLYASATGAGTATWHARRVQDMAVKRRVIAAGARITQAGYSATLSGFESLTEALGAFREISDGPRSEAAVEWGKAIPALLDELSAPIDDETHRPTSTGLRALDQLIGGLSPGQLVVVAGRPSMGKSVLGVDLCRASAFRQNRKSLLVSLEMNRREVWHRIVSAESGVPMRNIQARRLTEADWVKINAAVAATEKSPLIIDDRASMTLTGIESAVRQHSRNGGLGLLTIDYLQLIKSDEKHFSREQEVSSMTRRLKILAGEEQVPIIILAQLNRGPEARNDKRPLMSDLRESGAIEQDADIVILLHREEYYDPNTTRAGQVDLIVAKNRHGASGTVTGKAQFWYSRITD